MRFLPGGARLRGLVARLPRCGAPFGRVQCCECNEVMLAAQGRTQPAFDGMAAAVSFEEGAARIVAPGKTPGKGVWHPRWRGSCFSRCRPRGLPARWRRHTRAPPHAAGAASTTAVNSPAPLPAWRGSPGRGVGATPHLRPARARTARAHPQPAGALPGAAGRHGARPHPAHRRCLHHGSTMNAACDALRAAGAVELHCLVFARV